MVCGRVSKVGGACATLRDSSLKIVARHERPARLVEVKTYQKLRKYDSSVSNRLMPL